MWAPQQAARARQRASLASNRRRGRRIRRGRFRTYYRVSGTMLIGDGGRPRRASPPQRPPPKQGKKPAKADGSPIFSGIGRHYRVRRNPAFARADLEPCLAWNRIGPSVPSNQFHAISTRRLGKHMAKTPCPGQVSRRVRPRRLLSVIETAEPGNMRLDARYAISAARGECAPRRRP